MSGGVYLEFRGGPLDGLEIMEGDWPEDAAPPGAEILDKPTGSLYRYLRTAPEKHPV